MNDLTTLASDCFRVVTGAPPSPPANGARATTDAEPGPAADNAGNGGRAVPTGWRRLLRWTSWRPGSFEDAF